MAALRRTAQYFPKCFPFLKSMHFSSLHFQLTLLDIPGAVCASATRYAALPAVRLAGRRTFGIQYAFSISRVPENTNKLANITSQRERGPFDGAFVAMESGESTDRAANTEIFIFPNYDESHRYGLHIVARCANIASHK